MRENRAGPRTPMTCQVKISHPDFGELVANTRDISDGGIFLLTGSTQSFDLGSVLQGQVQLMGGDAPVLNMKIVRVEDDGIALQFVS